MKTSGSLRVIPGFGLSLGITLCMLSLFVLIPLVSIVLFSFKLSLAEMWQLVTRPIVLNALITSIECALAAAIINCCFGTIIAWVLCRYEFTGKKLLNGLIELPFALPTAVAGITLSNLYAPEGLLGKFLLLWGIKIAYTKAGIIIAMVFVGIPFVVRNIQPVLENFDPIYEEAAQVFGASKYVLFRKIIFPEIYPALLTGFSLVFARSLGEYGSVIYIAGNSFKEHTQVISYVIMEKLEHIDYASATAIALIMLIIAFMLLLSINLIHLYQRRKIS